MADESEIFIDGKPLSSLRVVDLKEELKKRGVKSSGNKNLLKDLLKLELIKEQQNQIQTQDQVLVPNLALKDDKLAEQNDIIKQYLSKQADMFQQQVEYRRQIQAQDTVETKSDGKPIEKAQGEMAIEPQKSESQKVVEQTDIVDLSVQKTLDSAKNNQEIKKPLEIPPKIEIQGKTSEISEQVKEIAINEITENKQSESNANSTKSNQNVEKEKITAQSETVITPKKIQLESISRNEPVQTEKVEETKVDKVMIKHTKSDVFESGKENTRPHYEPEKVEIVQTETKLASEKVETKLTSEKVESKIESKIEEEIESGKGDAIKVSSKPTRRRRWGGSMSSLGDNTSKGISSDRIRELIPDVEVSNGDATTKVSKTEQKNLPSNTQRVQSQSVTTNIDVPSKRDIRVVRKRNISDENSNDEQKGILFQPSNISRTVHLFPQESIEEQVKKPASPAKNTESNMIFITNLVRPFTLIQLHDILSKSGTLVKDRFWIDKVKKNCIATYSSKEEAIAAREALHGLRWPVANPNLLSVDFSNEEELQERLDIEKGIKKETPQGKNIEISITNDKYDVVLKPERGSKENHNDNELSKNQKLTDERPIREWDREKLLKKEEKSRKRRSLSQDKDYKRKRHDSKHDDSKHADEENQFTAAPDSESPAKLLDDLFKKTKMTPSIYWLPLTEEQVIAKEKEKADNEKKRIQDREARKDEPRRNDRMSPIRPQNRRSPPRRSPLRRSPRPVRRSPFRRYSPRRFDRRSRSPQRRVSPQRRGSPQRRKW